MRPKTPIRLVAAALLLVHAGLLAYGAAVHIPVIDEVGHMAAGLSHWQFGKFDLYHVNPPLVRMVAVVPVLWANPKVDWSQYSDAPAARSEFEIGYQLISDNGERSFWFFTWARWACIPFSLLALTLWCFGPNILANGQMITPDTGAAALGLTAAYVFWKWLKQPGWRLALGAGLGLALLTKTTWIILFGPWPALGLLWRLPAWWATGRAAGLVPADSTEPAVGTKTAGTSPSARPALKSLLKQSLMRGYEYSVPNGRGGVQGFPLLGFSYFQRFRPVGRAGWSNYIYHITPEECAQARREMGLPALRSPADAPGPED